MESEITKRRATAVLVAGLLGLAGLTTAGIGLLWVAGSLGISAAAASQIVNAIEAGGWALVVVIAIFGGGIIAAITATVRSIIARIGKGAAIA